MQSENGILLLFYIFLSHGNEKKKKKMKRGREGAKRGDAVSYPHAPVVLSRLTDMLYFWSNKHLHTIYINLNIVDGVIMVKLTYHLG